MRFFTVPSKRCRGATTGTTGDSRKPQAPRDRLDDETARRRRRPTSEFYLSYWTIGLCSRGRKIDRVRERVSKLYDASFSLCSNRVTREKHAYASFLHDNPRPDFFVVCVCNLQKILAKKLFMHAYT